MAQTLYASFNDASLAEKAAGALLDHGARNEDISIVARDEDSFNTTDTTRRDYVGHSATLEERRTTTTRDFDHGNDAVNAGASAWDATKAAGNKVAEGTDRLAAGVSRAFGADRAADNLEQTADERSDRAAIRMDQSRGEFNEAVDATPNDNRSTYETRTYDTDSDTNTTYVNHSTGDGDATEQAAKQGLSTTTAGDAAAGAAKGAGIGLGVGALAALASLAIPGFGLVVGGGALATALAGAAGATAAGAVAGGVHGYLKDQGVPDQIASDYDSAIQNGGALLSVHVPSNDLDEATCREILAKYGASNVNTYGIA